MDDTRVRSEAGTMVSMAEAQARATLERAGAEKDELLARAEGTAALIRAENAHSPDLIGLKLDQARIDALPGIVEKMMKPAEKIETIRINQISGLGGGSTGDGAGSGAAVRRPETAMPSTRWSTRSCGSPSSFPRSGSSARRSASTSGAGCGA